MTTATLKLKLEHINEVALTNPDNQDIITFSVVRMTPQQAQSLLDSNHHHNRRIKPSAVRTYAQLMSDDKWNAMTCEIMISKNGVLIDGAHRLHGLIQSGCKAVLMRVARGFDDDDILTVDNGVPRSLSDCFYIHDKKLRYPKIMASSVKLLKNLQGTFCSNLAFETVVSLKTVNNKDLVDFHSKLLNYNKTCDKFYKLFSKTKVGRVMSPSIALSMYFLLDDVCADTTFSVFKTFETGVGFDGLGKDSPAFKIADTIIKNKSLGKTYRQRAQIQLFLWAWTETKKGTSAFRLPTTVEWLFDDADMPEMKAAKRKLQLIN